MAAWETEQWRAAWQTARRRCERHGRHDEQREKDGAAAAEDETEGSSESSQVLVERELMWSWGWSIMQRVLFNEPLMIISVRGLPMLLRAQCARQLCSEALLEYVAQAVETGAGIAKEAIA